MASWKLRHPASWCTAGTIANVSSSGSKRTSKKILDKVCIVICGSYPNVRIRCAVSFVTRPFVGTNGLQGNLDVLSPSAFLPLQRSVVSKVEAVRETLCVVASSLAISGPHKRGAN
jgi:hypothetical protein